MRLISSMVDMARTPKEKEESVAVSPVDAVPDYPYGLCISLCEDELEKLNLDDEDVEIGDLIHFHALAAVTSISKNSNQSGDQRRIELQIRFMSAEDEADEDEGDEENEKSVVSRLYNL